MAGSAVPESKVAEPPGRAKISQVFQFLRALNEHRNPATRAIKDQLWSLRLRSVPAHPSVEVATLVQPQSNEDEASDVVLRVARPALTPAPVPPAAIRDWLQPSWTDAQKPLEYRQSRNETTPDGRGVVVSFDADPKRVRARDDWSKVREAWARNELPALRAAKLFEQLYELHGRIEREAECVELVLGDGLLSWQHEDGSIFHPLLLQRVQLRFDPSIPQFTVTDTGSVPDLYTALLRGIGDIDGKVLARCRAELSEGGFLPLGGDDTSGFLRRLGNVLSPATVFTGEELPAPSADPPQIGRDPVLFLRTRNLGFANALEGILADLPGRVDLPISLLRIVGTDVAPPAKEGAEAPAELWSEPEAVLLSKPANPEQIQIAQRLDRYGCVLVQGPPGTGKTHTIANLIGHLLAQGKSVLVTSQTTKALKVLREQVVPELRPLCVSVLENDLESRSQLEGAVTAIAGRLSSSNAERLDQEAAAFQKRRQVILQELHRARTALLDAQSDEYRDIVCAGKNWPPSDAARRVAADREQHSWVPSPVTLGAPWPRAQRLPRSRKNWFGAPQRLSAAGLRQVRPNRRTRIMRSLHLEVGLSPDVLDGLAANLRLPLPMRHRRQPPGPVAMPPMLDLEPSAVTTAPRSNGPGAMTAAPSPVAAAVQGLQRAVQATGAVSGAEALAPSGVTRPPAATAAHPPTAATGPRNLLAIGKSKEMVRNAIVKVLEPTAHCTLR